MKPIINPWLFYLVDCLDGLKTLCILACPLIVFVILYITITINMMVSSQITDNNIQKAEDTIKNSVDYIFEKINER